MDIVVKFVTDNSWIALVSCGVILVAALGLLILFVLRGRVAQPQSRPTQVSAFITSVEQPTVRFDLTRDVMTIGRAKGCDIQITEKHQIAGADSMSRQHARFERRDNRWLVSDGDAEGKPSTNGIFVNGARTRVNYLEDGVEIRFGEVAFVFHEPTPNVNSDQGGAR
jgi:pSer/pThr/pTyr-binding forkhead associated (FHA) protein